MLRSGCRRSAPRMSALFFCFPSKAARRARRSIWKMAPSEPPVCFRAFSVSRISSAIWAKIALPRSSPDISPAASSGRRRPRSARRCGSPRSRRRRRRLRVMSAFMSSAPMTTNSRPSFARRSTPWRWPTRTQTAAFTSTPCRARNRPFSAPPRNRSPHRCCAATSTRACASSRWGRGRASSTSAPVITAA